jgi:hypothetical protein
MFSGCKLDVPSIQKIANNINDILELNKDNDDDWTYSYYLLYDDLTKDDLTTISIEKSARGRIDIGHADDVSQEVL